MNPKTPTEPDIARKAYELWEAEGRPEGRDVAHWHQAERDVAEPVIDPVPDAPAAEAPVETAPKRRTTRARAAKPAEGADPAAAEKPKATRRRKVAAPEA
ncbi:MAG: DUF2934 domain-containing protein [Amaricoccus sp.]|uniref:DUF2934 domain-containing protein n=1 Tax=Amaricoccus sp. TaxID=1872485 RepID=UPI0039E574C9